MKTAAAFLSWRRVSESSGGSLLFLGGSHENYLRTNKLINILILLTLLTSTAIGSVVPSNQDKALAAPINELVAAPPFNRNLPAVAYGSTGTMLVEDTATDRGTGSDDHKAVQC